MTPTPISVPLANSATPVTFQLQGTGEIDIKSVNVEYDGSAAASDFFPVLSIYTSDDRLLSRTRVQLPVSAGQSAVVTFAPFLRQPISQGSGNLNLLYRTTLAADTASVTIPGIQQTYDALQLVVTAKSTNAGIFDALGMRFNGDTGNNYGWNQISYPTDGALNLGKTVPDSFIYLGEICAGATDATAFSLVYAVIGGYSNAATQTFTESHWTDTKYPTAVLVTGVNGGEYSVAGAITSITLFPASGPKFKAGTRITLYGL